MAYIKFRLLHWTGWLDDDLAKANALSDSGCIAQWIEQALSDQAQQVYKDSSDTRVAVIQSQSRLWLVKWNSIKKLRHRLMLWFRCGSLWRQWRSAAYLKAAGCRASSPVAILYRPGEQALIFPFIEGITLGRYLRGRIEASWQDQPLVGGRKVLAQAIGRQIGQLAAAGIVNRDHKATNVLIDHACYFQGADPVLLDPAGLRRRTRRQVLRMFCVLLQSVRTSGPFTMREAMICLRAAVRADPTLLPIGPAPIKQLARRIIDKAAHQI